MTSQSTNTERLVLELLELALSEASDARATFVDAASGYSQAVRSRAQAILAGGSGASSLRTGGADAFTMVLANPPSSIGGYRLIREIGRGGMGAVFEAEREQGDFEHKVAIKIIATGRLSETLVARFAQERQILAQLNHPYIARLYDGGETHDGLPYLVMELVDGEPLSTWLENGPDETECFLVLSKILEAVDYAHRTLVIHRDLSPTNVIVTADGGVKLIDFGISSYPSASSAPLSSGQTATPGYAAPENTNSDVYNTTIDIYALGKLMHLMFGSMNAPEITAIADKAADIDPEARYGTVPQLAADVERYKADYSVEAYTGGRGYKAGKYIRRNALALAAASMIALILAVSVSLLASAYGQEQTARQLAANRFEAVRNLAKFQLFDLYDAMEDIPNTVAARELVARNSIAYLNSLAITADASPDLRREAGEGWLRLSQVTGGSSGDNIGLPEGALSFGNRAIEILEGLHKEYPDDADTRLSLGAALGTLALDNLYIDGDSETGYARASRAVELLSTLEPDSPEIAGAAAKSYRALGDAYGWKNELPKAGAAYADGLEFVRALSPALQNSPGVLLQTPSLMRQLGEVYRYTGRPEEALKQMRDTVDFAASLLERAETSEAPSAQRNLSIVLWNIADMHRSLARWDEGLVYAERGITLVEAAIASNPEDIGWLEMRALIQTVIAPLKSGNGDHGPAIAAADRAISTLRVIREKSGENVGNDLAIAVGWKDVANVYRRAGQTDIACAGLAEANAIFTAYDAANALSEYDRENNMAPVREALSGC